MNIIKEDGSEVVLYSTGCPKCGVLKQKLDSNGIPYTVNSSVEDMLSLGISQVPVLSVNGTLMDFSDAIKWVREQG